MQREQIEGWARARKATIANIFEELDESGTRADRPMLMHALGRIEDGLTNGLVVSTLDRFGRSLLDGLAMIERIRAAGGIFVAVEDGFDLDTDTGQLVLRIMLAIAEWELSRNRAQWAIARERANARGIHIGRCAPYGYVHTPERRLTPDVGLVQFIVAVFRQRSEGASLTELASYLTNCDAPPSGRRWRAAAVQRLISNRVYLGELRDGLYVNPKAHPALVNRPVWNAAQRSGRMTVGRRKRRLPTVLGGLLRCAGCRLVLSSRTIVDATGSARRVYGCNDESPFGACPSRAWIKSREIEPYVDALFFQLCRPSIIGFRRNLASASSTPTSKPHAQTRDATGTGRGDLPRSPSTGLPRVSRGELSVSSACDSPSTPSEPASAQ